MLKSVLDAIAKKLSAAPPLGAKIKFDFGPDGIVFVDGTVNPPRLSQEDGEAVTTLACSLSTMQEILMGTQDPNMAFITGKLKVKGSMGYALKLNGLLED